MIKWLKRKLNISCEFEENCVYNGRWPCKRDHDRYKDALKRQGGMTALFERQLKYISKLDVDKITDITFSADLIWLHSRTDTVTFGEGLGMYLDNEHRDKLIQAVWDKFYGTSLAGKILHHMMNRKHSGILPPSMRRGGPGGPSAAG